jgi:hypothetical protein
MEVGGSCWRGVLVGQCAVVWRIGGVTVVMVCGSSHRLKRPPSVDPIFDLPNFIVSTVTF